VGAAFRIDAAGAITPSDFASLSRALAEDGDGRSFGHGGAARSAASARNWPVAQAPVAQSAEADCAVGGCARGRRRATRPSTHHQHAGFILMLTERMRGRMFR